MLSNQSISAIQSAISEAVDHVPHEDDFEVITDLHMHIDADTGMLTIADDNGITLSETSIDELIGFDDELPIAVNQLTTLLHRMADDGRFTDTHIAKPFAFVLEDKDNETIDDLYVVDDEDTIYIPGTLLQGMDEDLDNFLRHLMDD